MFHKASKPVAISMGDPAGIGPDIILTALNNEQSSDVVIFGDPEIFKTRAKALGMKLPDVEIAPTQPACDCPVGQPSKQGALAAIDALEKATDAVLSGSYQALVTAPINKKNLYEAGFEHPGHTEFLGAFCKARGFSAQPVMMLASDLLRVVPITIHIPLKDVPKRLTQDLIITTAEIAARDLKRYFSIENPRLAFAGLNPHAGEEGAMGLEEKEIILPAIEQLQKKGITCLGPYPADTMFHARARQIYDVALCAYHDQALIPLKTLSFDDGANITLGLPFIRTSPDHGTAYDIAGTGKARADSFAYALKIARTMSQNALET